MKQRANNQFLAGLTLFLISLASILILFSVAFILGDKLYTVCIIGFTVMAGLLLAYGWLQLYRIWKRRFLNAPIDGIYQIVSLLVWLLLLGVTGSITVFFLRLFGLF